MTQLELFEDEEPTKRFERKSFTFVGSTSASLSLDPNEFVGLSVPQITDEIKAILAGIAPGIDFFEQELVEAANDLAAK